jgi:biopolymer transport protein ExbD
MPERRRFQGPPSGLAFNFTPLIDVFFLLTIFFMLVSRFTTVEQMRVDLPAPRESVAKVPRMADRIVVNCRLAESEGEGESVIYSLGPNPPGPLSVVADQLAALKQQTPEVRVVIRADRRLRYEQVRSVMRVLAELGVPLLNVAAVAREHD